MSGRQQFGLHLVKGKILERGKKGKGALKGSSRTAGTGGKGERRTEEGQQLHMANVFSALRMHGRPRRYYIYSTLPARFVKRVHIRRAERDRFCSR